MALDLRGGVPRVMQYNVGTGGEKRTLAGITRHIQISNDGANKLRIYFTKADFTADQNFIELPASTGWYDGPAETGTGASNPDNNGLWMRGVVGAATGTLVYYYRH